MAVNPGVWGIDIGQCALKALRLEQVNGVVTATAFDYVEHPKILSQPDANPDELTREALEKFLSRNPTKGDLVAMSVPGQSGLARFVKLPPVEEKKIVDIVKFEAKQQIPFPLDEVVWDYQKVSEGTVTDGFAMDTEIGLFAMKRDMISRFIGHFQAVKLEVHHVQMTPLALANFVTYEMLKRGGIDGEAPPAQAVGKKKCVVALDIGTEGSNLIITDGARIIWQRPIPVGGNHFTRALTKELKLTFAKAEHLKRNAAKSPELANILKALRPVLQEFVGEVQRSLGYFTNTHRDAQVEYMVGLGSAFKLPGLQKFLADKLSLEVRKIDKFARVSGEAVAAAPVFRENILSFPVAYGLALQGLGTARLTTNLLPPEITFERKIRAKKPYAVAAAAALLLGTTVLAAGYSVPLADVTDPQIKSAIDKAKGVVSTAKNLDGQIATKKGEVDQTQTEVESIIAGQAERSNWIVIHRFVNDSVPVPGPVGKEPPKPYHNMTGPLEQYWSSTKGIRAVEKLQERIAKGVDPLAALTAEGDDLREHLAMVDIEAVYARYSTNLKQDYQNIEDKRRREIGGALSFPGSVLNPDDWWEKKPDRAHPPRDERGAVNVREELKPDGEGWVVEVRGSTYWHPDQNSETDKFIRDTLVKNIIDRSRSLPEPKTDAEKEALAKDTIRGKISHVFIYNVWEDKNPSAGVFQQIGRSLIHPLVGAAGATDATGGGIPPGMGPGTGAAGFGGPPGSPDGMGGPLGGSSGSGWRPLDGSVIGAASGGSGFGMGMMGGAGGPMTPALPGTGSEDGKPGYGIPPGAPSPGAGVPPPKGVKIKPRFEFVIVFTWKEPTPSDKLRQIKKREAAAVDSGTMGSGKFGGSMPGPSSPAPGPSGDSGGGDLRIRGGVDDS
jgi:type IV pilus assembly protein PilM